MTHPNQAGLRIAGNLLCVNCCSQIRNSSTGPAPARGRTPPTQGVRSSTGLQRRCWQHPAAGSASVVLTPHLCKAGTLQRQVQGIASAEALAHLGSRSAPLSPPRPHGLRPARCGRRRRRPRRQRRRRRLRRRRRCRPVRRARSASGRAWNPRILRGRGRRRSAARGAQPQPCRGARPASAGPRRLQLLQRCRGRSVRSLSGVVASSKTMRHQLITHVDL